jgi:hypothetical protein
LLQKIKKLSENSTKGAFQKSPKKLQTLQRIFLTEKLSKTLQNQN